MTIARLRGGSNGRAAERSRYVELIAHCGKLGGKSRGCQVAGGRMRPCRIVVGDPATDDLSGMIEAEEQRLVQELVPHLRIESLEDAVLHRLAGGDEMPTHAGLLAPGQYCVRGELGAMIADDEVGLAAPGDQRRQLPCNAAARDRGVDHGGEAFLGDVVDHVEDPEPPALGELVVDGVDRPARVRHGHCHERRPCPGRLLPPPPLAHGEALLAVEPLGLLAVHDISLPTEQNVQPPVAKPAALRCQRPQALAQIVVIGSSAAVADRGPVRADHGTRPPLAHLVLLHEDRDGFTPGGGRYHFRDRRSFSAA